MVIKSVRAENYRSIFDETIECDALTALVGANGSGKSAFLRAIDLFYSTTPKIIAEDFYNELTGNSIRITISFGELNDEEKSRFARYVRNDQLTVAAFST
jgi:putative ATP-dependent endonuclease of the OLD family